MLYPRKRAGSCTRLLLLGLFLRQICEICLKRCREKIQLHTLCTMVEARTRSFGRQRHVRHQTTSNQRMCITGFVFLQGDGSFFTITPDTMSRRKLNCYRCGTECRIAERCWLTRHKLRTWGYLVLERWRSSDFPLFTRVWLFIARRVGHFLFY